MNEINESGKQSETPPRPIRDARGLFLPGNPGSPGRPKSSRHKLAEAFFRDLQAAWDESGPEVLRQVVGKTPGELLRAVAGLMPKELTVEMVDPESALRALDDEPATPVLPDTESGSQGVTGSATGNPEEL